MTENELRKKFWWWRKSEDWTFDPVQSTTRLKPSSKNHKWKEHEELIAWWYELARRHKGKEPRPPYPEAKAKDPFILKCLEEFSQIRQRRKALRVDELPVSEDPSISQKSSWSGLLQCDLQASDHQLTASLLQYVRAERKKRNIKAARGAKGKRHRPVSWHWPELMDLAHFIKNPALNAADRSKLSKARKLARFINNFLDDWFTPLPE
jgi:hypothetical protein